MQATENGRSAKHERKPLALILIKRAAFLFFLGFLFSFFFWIVGSFSYFLDGTQRLFLGILRVSSLLLIVDAAVGIVARIVYAIVERRWPGISAFLGYAFCLLMGFAGLILSNALLILGKGLS